MKKVAILSSALALALAATAATAQVFTSPAGRGLDTVNQVYLQSDTRDQISSDLSDAVRKALEDSRVVTIVESMTDTTRVTAPSKVTTKTNGNVTQVQMSYEISLPNGDPVAYRATCTAANLDVCAKAVASRMDRLVREYQRQ